MKLSTIIKYFRPPPPRPTPPLTLANEYDLSDTDNDERLMLMAYGARDIIGSRQKLDGRRARDVIPTLPKKRRKTMRYQFVRWMMRLQGARDGYRITIPKKSYRLPVRYKWDL